MRHLPDLARPHCVCVDHDYGSDARQSRSKRAHKLFESKNKRRRWILPLCVYFETVPAVITDSSSSSRCSTLRLPRARQKSRRVKAAARYDGHAHGNYVGERVPSTQRLAASV
jgi:hypothetical protein